LISEWRRTRDAGLLTGKPAGAVVGRPSADQAEIARLSGVSRATAHRRAVLGPPRPPVPRRAPVNRLSPAEWARILAVLNSDRFVDTTPIEGFATRLGEGIYLASVATLYRVLRENRQVVERCRLARHPSRARPELIAAGPGQVFSWDITKLPGPSRAST
jgi:putative transposase